MNWPLARDTVLFLGGLSGVAHETLVQHADRPTLLILFAAMMGLPAFLAAETKPQWAPRKRHDHDEKGEPRRGGDLRRREGVEDDTPADQG